MSSRNEQTLIRPILELTLVVLVGACAGGRSSIQYDPIPPTILTPDRVETRLGTLEFFDGYPNPETVAAVYDNLDFQRGVRAFLDALPIASLYAMREGLQEVGAVNNTVGIFEDLMDSRTLLLTANTESVYGRTLRCSGAGNHEWRVDDAPPGQVQET
jgi:hypothetical protein